jgi:hypothetical protein
MVSAVERVRQRLFRARNALDRSNIPYAVVGGNAVAAWVSTVDEGAVRNTGDVDVMVNRHDLEAVQTALVAEGFSYRHVAGKDIFLDSADSSPREAVHLVYANELVRDGEPMANPSLEARERSAEFSILGLEALVQIKLTAFRDKDKTHLRDLIDVGLIDAAWTEKVPEPLKERLQSLRDTPNG